MLVRETAGALRGLRMEPAGLVVACRRIVERHPTSGPLWWFCASMLTSGDPFRAANDLAGEIECDVTPDHLYELLPDDATVCVVGWPDLIGDAVMRRGDVRVLAIDADDEGSSFVRRLQRADIEADIVPPGGIAAAVLAADVVLVEALAAGAGEALVLPPSRAVASTGYCSEVPTWLIAGRGRRLPEGMFTSMLTRIADVRAPWEAEAEAAPLGLFAAVVGPTGFVDAAHDALAFADVLAAECPMAHELLRSSAI
jgi:hypothetical protein